MVERHPYKVDVAGSNPVLPTKYLKSLLNFNLKKSKMVKTVGKMGQVLGLTKNNDLYEDVPDDLKWAIPLHEHLVGYESVLKYKNGSMNAKLSLSSVWKKKSLASSERH